MQPKILSEMPTYCAFLQGFIFKNVTADMFQVLKIIYK